MVSGAMIRVAHSDLVPMIRGNSGFRCVDFGGRTMIISHILCGGRVCPGSF